jgi:hypothetical protein
LDNVATAILQGGTKERAKADVLMVSLVTAVVENNVKRTKLFVHLGKKLGIGLATDPYEHLAVRNFMVFTGLVDVDTDDRRVRMKIVFPHAQRSAAKNANFEHFDRTIAVPAEVFRVDIKIMMPLVDIGIGSKNIEQRVYRCFGSLVYGDLLRELTGESVGRLQRLIGQQSRRLRQ